MVPHSVRQFIQLIEKILKIKNSVTGIYLLNFDYSYHTEASRSKLYQ